MITYAFSTPTLLGLMVMVKAMASGWPWQQKPKGPPPLITHSSLQECTETLAHHATARSPFPYLRHQLDWMF